MAPALSFVATTAPPFLIDAAKVDSYQAELEALTGEIQAGFEAQYLSRS